MSGVYFPEWSVENTLYAVLLHEMGHAWVNVTYLDDEDFEAAVTEREQLLGNTTDDGGQ